MVYRSELEMYPWVIRWLQQFLAGRFPKAQVTVYDTQAADLNRFIRRHGLQALFTSDVWQTYEIRVDVTAFVVRSDSAAIVFAECKNRAISLRDLSQLLGYCRIAHPLFALLISPLGPGDALRSLVLTHGRTDVLEYDWPRGSLPRAVTVARWNAGSQDLDMASILPPGTIRSL
jgi:hypothetical protein